MRASAFSCARWSASISSFCRSNATLLSSANKKDINGGSTVFLLTLSPFPSSQNTTPITTSTTITTTIIINIIIIIIIIIILIPLTNELESHG
jgi:hypothetical protein